MKEQLTQALNTAQFTAEHLRAALSKASAIEALLLMPMLAAACKLQSEIDALRIARAQE